MLNRRHFLRTSLAGLGAGAGFATNLASLSAFAADTDNYKALVCVFLQGGLDPYDTLIPFDHASYNDFEVVREPILQSYDIRNPRRRSQLLPLTDAHRGRQFAFPPEFSRISELYDSGNAAVVANVGPLIEPINRASFLSKSGILPPKLFSHNDQESCWMAFQPEGAGIGWGGRFGDIMQAAQANTNSAFTAVSTTNSSVFLTGRSVRPFVTAPTGAASLNSLDRPHVLGSRNFSAIYEQILRDVHETNDHLFQRDLVKLMNASLDNNAILDEQLSVSSDPMTEFSSEGLAQQLRMVSRLIARKDSFGMKRQVFFVSMGGFDTHSGQAETLSEKQGILSDAIGSFYDSLVELGMENSVTTFTASDFGRTLGVNGDGTDHGWGGHHIVVGGAVNGGKIIGDVPPVAFGHDLDAGRGRLIPQFSVDQYAGELGRWFGLSEGELDDAIPGLRNFDRAALGSLFVQ